MAQKNNRPVLTPKAARVAAHLAQTQGSSISAAVSRLLERLEKDLSPPGDDLVRKAVVELQRNGHVAQARLIGNAWETVVGTWEDPDPESSLDELAELLMEKGVAYWRRA